MSSQPSFAAIGDTRKFTKPVAISSLQTREPTMHRVSVPAHKAVRIGTLNALLRAVANHEGVDRQTILDSL